MVSAIDLRTGRPVLQRDDGRPMEIDIKELEGQRTLQPLMRWGISPCRV